MGRVIEFRLPPSVQSRRIHQLYALGPPTDGEPQLPTAIANHDAAIGEAENVERLYPVPVHADQRSTPNARWRNLIADRVSGTSDVCAYLYQVCKRCQVDVLDSRGITLRFDVQNARVPTWQCEVVGRIIRFLIDDICRTPGCFDGMGTITVTLRHTGTAWVLTITDEGIRPPAQGHGTTGFSAARALARLLDGVWRVKPVPGGTTTALWFGDDPEAVGRTHH